MKSTSNLILGNCIDKLKEIESGTVQTCVTSPPYYGLRDYVTAEWKGGDINCSHRRESKKSDKTITGHKNFDDMLGVGDAIQKSVCAYCGAIRVDNQIGLEETPSEYVRKLVEVFREVKRILKDDGTLWLNLGDSYSSHKDCKSIGQTLAKGTNRESAHEIELGLSRVRDTKMLKSQGLKNKDLIGIPWRVAFALQEDGWYLRQDIIWHKPNPMPESVTDRCTKSHEYIFLLSKSDKYYFDNDAIKEKAKYAGDDRGNRTDNRRGTECNSMSGKTCEFRNKRSVWSINTKPYKESHFATFPEDLPKNCIKAGSKEGDIVLDPFNGAGTTGVVSAKLNRNYIGIELNEKYIKISQDRIDKIYENISEPLFDMMYPINIEDTSCGDMFL